MTTAPLGIGLIGCGAFGRFAVEHYKQLPQVNLVAVADQLPAAAQVLAAQLGVAACATVGQMFRRSDVDLVYIATPPTTHYTIVMQALAHDKHVLCEKPLSTRLDDAHALITEAKRRNKILAVNLIMRYNPLAQWVQSILREQLLGEVLHGFFENYASDENLLPDHWFWDKQLAGGIFVEHGVHFFDLFQMWLGPGKMLAAQQVLRPEAAQPLVEQVHCSVVYGGTVVVQFYHGFHQSTRMDRQELRLVCERGSIQLYDWVATRLEIDALLSTAALQRLQSLMPDAEVEQCAKYVGDQRAVTSRHKRYEVDGRYRLRVAAAASKTELYGTVLRGLLADQVAAIHDSSHVRRVSEANGLESLQMAVTAETLAQQSPLT